MICSNPVVTFIDSDNTAPGLPHPPAGLLARTSSLRWKSAAYRVTMAEPTVDHRLTQSCRRFSALPSRLRR